MRLSRIRMRYISRNDYDATLENTTDIEIDSDISDQDAQFKSIISDDKPARVTPSLDHGNSNTPPMLRPGQRSGIGRYSRPADEQADEVQDHVPPEDTSMDEIDQQEQKGQPELPPLIRPKGSENPAGTGGEPGTADGRRGLRYRPRSVTEGQGTDESGDLPYIRPPRGPKNNNKPYTPTDLPATNPNKTQANRRGGGNIGGLAGIGDGQSALDGFRRHKRRGQADDGPVEPQPTDKVDRIIGGIINGVNVDIVLRNGEQYELYENDERVFYASREEVEQWQQVHGQKNISDALMDYREAFVAQMNRRDFEDE